MRITGGKGEGNEASRLTAAKRSKNKGAGQRQPN